MKYYLVSEKSMVDILRDPKEDIVAKTTGYKWWKRKFKITIPALAAIIYKVEFLPEPKEIPLPMLDEASIDIDRKRLRAELKIDIKLGCI